MGVGPWQLAVLVLLVLLVFGASRLGEIGRGLGEGVRAFKKSMSGERRREPDEDEDEDEDEPREQLRAGRERAVQNRRHVMAKRSRKEDEDEGS